MAQFGLSDGLDMNETPSMYEMEGASLDLPIQAAGLPGSTGSGGPTAGASHPRPVPVSRFLQRPRVPPGVVSVSDVDVFLLLTSRAAQEPAGSN